MTNTDETDTSATHRPRTGSLLAFHLSRIVIDVGVLMALAAMSLPFVTSPSGDRNAIEADALPALLLLVPVFLITLIPDHAWPIPPPLGWVSLVLGAAAFPYAVVKRLDAGLLARTLDGQVGFGANLLVLGTVVVLAGIVYGLVRAAMGIPTGGSATRTERIPRGRVRPIYRRAPAASGSGRPAAGTRPQPDPKNAPRPSDERPPTVTAEPSDPASKPAPRPATPQPSKPETQPPPDPGTESRQTSTAPAAGQPQPEVRQPGVPRPPSSNPDADPGTRPPTIEAPRARRPVIVPPHATPAPPEGESEIDDPEDAQTTSREPTLDQIELELDDIPTIESTDEMDRLDDE